MPTDTHIDSDSASCRAVAAWLTTVGQAATGTASTINANRQASEGGWRGRAGDGFHDRAGQLTTTGDDLADSARTGSRALDDFAAAVDAVKNTMAQARSIAAAAGLPVTGEMIEDPLAALGRLPARAPPAAVASRQQAADAASAQAAAYAQAAQLAQDARTRYEQAQDQLRSALKGPTDIFDSAGFKWGVRLSLVPPTAAGSLYSAAQKWSARAGQYGEEANALKATIAAGPGPAGNPIDDFIEQQKGFRQASRFGASNDSWLLGLDKKPVVGSMVRGGAKVAPEVGLLGKAAPVLRNVPVLSVGATALGTGLDHAAGRSWGDSAAKNVTQTAVGTGVAVGVGEAAFATLAVAGGPVTLAAVGLGFAASWAIGDHWDDIKGAFS